MGIKITYIRASTLILEFSDFKILTDPWFRNNLRGLRCLKPPGIALEKLPPIDLIIVSHLHPDHFDLRAITLEKKRNPQLSIIGPIGIKRFLQRSFDNLEIEELDFQDTVIFKGIKITVTPARHSGRENNYIIQNEKCSIFFGGDCNFSGQFKEIGETHPVDIALLPIGGTKILGKQIVMDIEDAFKAASLLKTKVFIPIHEGGIWQSIFPFSQHPGRVEALLKEGRDRGFNFEIVVLKNGESFLFETLNKK